MRVVLLAAMLVAVSGAAFGARPYVRSIVCPVGGEKFTYVDTMSSSSWGQRPDGKPYGSWVFPSPIPQCPSNGLPVYREFSRGEVRKLGAYLQSAEFTQIRNRDTPYYLAYRIERLLRPASAHESDVLGLLLQASWQADGDPSLKRRYQEEFADAMDTSNLSSDDPDRLIMPARAANALRELGRFDEAAALLNRFPRQRLDVRVPEEVRRPLSGPGNESNFTVENWVEIGAAEKRRDFLGFIDGLAKLVARRDASSEPLDMLPLGIAASLCIENASKPGWDVRGFCKSSEVVAEGERLEQRRREFEESTRRLLNPQPPSSSNP